MSLFFLLPGSEHAVGREFFICEDAAFVTPDQFVPDLYSVTLFLLASSNTAYSLSGIGRFDKILLCPHEDGQEQRLSSASIKFLWLRQIHDPSGIRPALYNALSTLLSFDELLFTTLFSCPRSRFPYTSSSGGHTQ